MHPKNIAQMLSDSQTNYFLSWFFKKENSLPKYDLQTADKNINNPQVIHTTLVKILWKAACL